MRFLSALTLLVGFLGCGDDGPPPPQPGPHLIYIDIDDHGLSALWDSNSPNMQRMAREGVLAYSRVDLPTHSNQSNITLLTGAWPEVTDVPHNSWLDRAHGYRQPFILTASLSAGSYIYYDQNPLGSRVASIYGAAHDAMLRSTYVGLLPPFEHGADEVHFTIYQSELLGLLRITKQLADTVLMMLHYPPDVIAATHYDGPPNKDESLNHFTLRDAAQIWRQAAAGGPPPPQLMFVWDFIALDNDPTSTDGAAGPAVKKIVEDIDSGIGELMAAVQAAGYADRTSYVLTLDQGKVDTHNQVAFEKQLGDLIAAQGAAHNVTVDQVKTLNEDGDVLVYAAVDNAGTAAGAAQQMQVTHGLVELIQSGAIMGLDTSRTITWDGYLGTRRFYDIRSSGPNNPDIIAFPQDDWTLNDVAKNATPGAIGRPNPYGRHGGVSIDELYVPAIFYGPAFKKGVVLPVPIDHPDVAPTAVAVLGLQGPNNAQGGVLQAVLASDSSGIETIAFPSDPHTTRPTVLDNAGYSGSVPHLPGAAAQGAILIDVSGLYEDDFPTGSNVSALKAAGTRFVGMRTRFRDWPVTEYQMITGTYPPFASGYVPFAEDDPAQAAPPGQGQFLMPPAANFISDTAGFTAWHSGTDKYADQSLFAAAKAAGFSTAVLGQPDFHLAHVQMTGIDVTPTAGMSLDQFLAANARALVLLAIDGGADPKGAAETAVGMIQQALQAAGLTGKFAIVLTSRGGAAIDAAMADSHGPGSARHVPLVIAGPNIRAGVTVGGPAAPADLAPTILFALGLSARAPDLAFGVQLDGGMSTGPNPQPLPLPQGDRDGRVLLQAFMR